MRKEWAVPQPAERRSQPVVGHHVGTRWCRTMLPAVLRSEVEDAAHYQGRAKASGAGGAMTRAPLAIASKERIMLTVEGEKKTFSNES